MRNALERLREVVATGELGTYLAVDSKSGEPVHPEARTIFSALPMVTPSTTADEIVELGLWQAPPHNLRRAFEVPRYRRGRELFVRAPVSHRPRERHRPVGYYEDGALLAFTHRAELRARAGDNFVVALDGTLEPRRFPRADIFAWNEPTPIATSGAVSGVQIDYGDPLMKAHVCAAYIDLASDVPKLDFSTDDPVVHDTQARLIRRVASRIRMTYAGRGDGYAGPRAGALLSGGQGVCFVQRAAVAALLAAFSRTLAFDLQVVAGRTLRLGVAHGFAVVTLRPALARFVVDPAWGEPLTDLRVAFFGPSWGHDRRLERIEGTPEVRVPPEATDLPEVTA